jgi:hypothetical protein
MLMTLLKGATVSFAIKKCENAQWSIDFNLDINLNNTFISSIFTKTEYIYIIMKPLLYCIKDYKLDVSLSWFSHKANDIVHMQGSLKHILILLKHL